MLDKWKSWVKNKNNFVVVFLVGVLFLVMLIPVGDSEDEDGQEDGRQTLSSQERVTGNVSMGDTLDSTQAYCLVLEEKLATLLSQIEGVGKTQVMITMQYSEEKIVETENALKIQETTETDAGGGTRVVTSTEESVSAIYESSSNDSIPYVIKIQVPKVQGVMVVAQGAGNGDIDLKITQAVQALLGIDVHKIAIAKMEAQ
ncbi:MAG: hypothetical protein IJW63_10840 [Lachnospiraceae bacterium]|nr:hypothetical protein [Lachnospiraceae bacterium]